MTFAGKIAFITGGSSGIGKATATQLAAAGAHLFIVARDQTKLDAAISELKGAAIHPTRQTIEGCSVDVAEYDQVYSAVRRLRDAGFVPDYLFNFAGIAYPGYFQEVPLRVFRETMDINYFGTLHTCKTIAPLMMARGSGHIINTSSMAGMLGIYGYSAYGATKYAIRGLSEVLRAELKCYGVKVSVLFPSDVDTPQLWFENHIKPAETRAIAAGSKILTPEQVAKDLLKGVEKGRFYIIPGLESKLVRALMGILGERIYVYFDWIVRRIQRQTGGPKKVDPDQCELTTISVDGS